MRQVQLPAVVGVIDVINQPHYPSLKGLNPFHVRHSRLRLIGKTIVPWTDGDVHNLVAESGHACEAEV